MSLEAGINSGSMRVRVSKISFPVRYQEVKLSKAGWTARSNPQLIHEAILRY